MQAELLEPGRSAELNWHWGGGLWPEFSICYKASSEATEYTRRTILSLQRKATAAKILRTAFR